MEAAARAAAVRAAEEKAEAGLEAAARAAARAAVGWVAAARAARATEEVDSAPNDRVLRLPGPVVWRGLSVCASASCSAAAAGVAAWGGGGLSLPACVCPCVRVKRHELPLGGWEVDSPPRRGQATRGNSCGIWGSSATHVVALESASFVSTCEGKRGRGSEREEGRCH